jgi:hypothetical protein
MFSKAMSSTTAGRVRTVLLAVVTGGALAVSSCQTGGQGVTKQQACQHGAQFDCPPPTQSNT